jgi:hypothetical protein
VSGSIGLGALVLCRRPQSSRAHVRNLYARMYAIFTGLSSVLECSVPLRLRGITIGNAHSDQQGTASINPIFTSVPSPTACRSAGLRRYKPSHYRVRRSSEAIVAKWSISRLCLAVVFIER